MFVVCGEALWDLFATEREDGLTFEAVIGGSPLNVALGLRRLEVPSALLTGLSTDRLGERILDVLNRERVDTSLLVKMTNPTTLSLVDVGKDGSPAYAFYGEAAADRSLRSEDLPPLPPEVWGLHAGSYSLAVDPVGSSLLGLMRREAGRRLITIDPNVRLNVEPDVSVWCERIEDFAASADLVKASVEDLELLYPGVPHDRTVRRWLDAGVTLVVLTQGLEGATAFGPFGRVEAGGRSVEVVDCVGAGDAFQAALIAGLEARDATTSEALRSLGGDEMAALLKFSNAAAAIACSRRGANLPTHAEAARFALDSNRRPSRV